MTKKEPTVNQKNMFIDNSHEIIVIHLYHRITNSKLLLSYKYGIYAEFACIEFYFEFVCVPIFEYL